MPLERRSTAFQNRASVGAWGDASRDSHTSPAFTPATAAHSAVASRCAFKTPARSNRSAAASSAWATDERRGASGTQPLLLIRPAQRADQIFELAVEHLFKIVHRIVNAVIGDPVLRKVVGANLRRAVAGADLSAALPGARRFLRRQHAVEEARAQHLHRLDLVLQLALLILALHHQTGRQVRDAHRAVGGV